MMRGGAIVFSGLAVGYLVQFGRNVLLAWVLSVADYGLATTFALAMAALEMATNLSFDRLLVQARDGDEPRLQASLQLLQVVRGLTVGAILYLGAGPLAAFLGAGDVVWAYQLLALAPVIRGFAHLDIFRKQREMRFGPSMVVALGSQVGSLVVLAPLAFWLEDYRAMLYALILQEVIFTALSFTAAERRYALAWNRDVLARVFTFCWPLMINGLLLFAIFNGDRLIVANQLGWVELGWFSAALTLTLAPTLLVANTMHTVMLPRLSRETIGTDAFESAAIAAFQAGLLAGIGIVTGFAIFGPWLFLMVFGAKFAPAASLIVILAATQAIRVAKTGSTTLAVACGATRNPMYANLGRLAVLPVAWFVLSAGGGLHDLVLVALCGEFVALAISMALLIFRCRLRVRRLARPSAGMAVTLVLVALAEVDTPATADLLDRLTLAQGAIVLSALVTFLLMRELHRLLLAGQDDGPNQPSLAGGPSGRS